MSAVTYDKSAMKTLGRQLTELEAGRAHVGFFSDTAGRVSSRGRIADNPSLALVHEAAKGEFGVSDRKFPQRSILRMPLMDHLGPALKAGAFDWIRSLRKLGAKRTLAFLGAVAEDVVQEAFATRGFGRWAPLSPKTIARKKSSAILIESAQMRKAVSSRIV